MSIKRNRLTHAQFHQACVWLGGRVNPGTSEVHATINNLIDLAAQDLGIELNRAQVKNMLEATSITCTLENANGAAHGDVQLQLASHAVAILELQIICDELLRERKSNETPL
jgi:hypothetical protein